MAPLPPGEKEEKGQAHIPTLHGVVFGAAPYEDRLGRWPSASQEECSFQERNHLGHGLPGLWEVNVSY